MELARMQDIGGLRAIVESVTKVRELEKVYLESNFRHQLATPHKDYIQHPKSDGYRGIHLVYKYRSELAPAYDGLNLELQLRTRLQHAWATAVETMGTFLGQALKSGQGEGQWKAFFEVSSAAIALLEKCPPILDTKDFLRARHSGGSPKPSQSSACWRSCVGFPSPPTAFKGKKDRVPIIW